MRRPRFSTRSGKALLAVLVVVFVLLAIVVLWMRRGAAPTQPSVDEGKAVAEAFLNQIRAGRPQQAWDSTTAEFKSAEGRESFVRYVKKYPFLAKPMSFVSMQTVTVGDSPRAEFLYRSEDGKSVRLLAGQEGGSWRVDRIAID